MMIKAKWLFNFGWLGARVFMWVNGIICKVSEKDRRDAAYLAKKFDW